MGGVADKWRKGGSRMLKYSYRELRINEESKAGVALKKS